MNRNVINVSKKSKYKIPLKLSWLKSNEESIVKSLKREKPVEVDVFITDDRKIRKLNREYRNIDKATDVLSFCMQEKEPGGFAIPDDEVSHLGEIIISMDTAMRDAAEQGIGLEKEIQFLLIHGTLHLLGYDHEKAADGRAMRKKEDEVFRALAVS
jgi:probable rRNA maturation factor